MKTIRIQHDTVSNNDGWRLELKCSVEPEQFNPDLRPVVIVPGYGMNSFIFGYHPTGLSMEAYLALQGFEVWSVNLRTQGGSVCEGGEKEYGLHDVSLVDLPVAVEAILDRTKSNRDQVDLVGCSLGGTIVYIYAALHGTDLIGSMVGLGAPLRWDAIHPVLKFAFRSPAVAGALKMSNTRMLARMGLPILAKIPALLSIYLHPDITDISDPGQLCRTVEDPNRTLNREIALWFQSKDLYINGMNVSDHFHHVKNPLLCLLANGDGIVPEETALSALNISSSTDKTSLVAGNDTVKMAHADMFISRYSEQMVFSPLADWLLSKNS